MVVYSMLPHAEIEPNDHRKDAPPFTLYILGLNWVADRIHGEAADLIDLEEFRTKLKIFYQDVVHEVEEQLEEVKGQIEEAKLKSAETLENVSDEVKQLELGITKKVEELYSDTKETLGNYDLE